LSEDLSRYKIIYICGSHIRRDVAQKLAAWVEAGGTLYADGGGLALDEACRPLDALMPVLGLEGRDEMALWSGVPRYGAVGLGRFSKVADPPADARVVGEGPFTGTFDLAVGREVLKPVREAEVLARYADGGAAVTRHRCGKGQAYVVGFHAGLEYSAPVLSEEFDMSRNFEAGRRSFVVAPALAAGVKPVVDAAAPCVECVLLKNRRSGRRAAVLINWAYARGPGGMRHVPCENLSVTIRGAGNVSRVTSAALEKTFDVTKDADSMTVVLPRLDEGDILLLEEAR
jgi:hypothetical protein